jgi:hypothetical protein
VSATPDAAARAVAAVRVAASTFLPPTDAEALIRALLPLMSGRSGEAPALGPPGTEAARSTLVPSGEVSAPFLAAESLTPAVIRQGVRDSGLFFEARLRELLEASPPVRPEQALTILQSDAKTLLARLASAASSSAQLPGEVAQQILQSGDRAPLVALPALAEGLRMAADGLLAQQLETAYRWVNDGSLTFGIPLRLPDGQQTVLVQFRRNPDSAAPAGTAGGLGVSIHVDSPVFGPVHATARWRGQSVQAAFFVEREAARAALEGQVERLRAGLGSSFTSVSVDVSVDPARAGVPQPPADPQTLPGGSIVSVRI